MCSGILPFVILILINLFQTRMKKQLISVMVAASLLTACGGAPKTTAKAEKFDYTVEQFADLQILRYRVPEFENLSLKQKELVYYLTEAALHGDNDEVFIGRDWGHARNYGEGVAATIDQEVNRIVTDAYREAKRLLQENMEMLHATAKLLVEKEKVTGDEFRSLFDQKVRNEVLGIANEAEQPTETAENREEN